MGKVVFVAVAMILLAGGSAFAVDGGQTLPAGVQESPKALPAHQAAFYVTAAVTGLSLAIAAGFGAMGQSRAIAASVEAIARQPEAGGRIFVSMIIGLALIETLVIYTLVIAFVLSGKLAG